MGARAASAFRCCSRASTTDQSHCIPSYILAVACERRKLLPCGILHVELAHDLWELRVGGLVVLPAADVPPVSIGGIGRYPGPSLQEPRGERGNVAALADTERMTRLRADQ